MDDLDMLGADEVHTQEDLRKVMKQWRQEAEAERQKGIDKEREWRLVQEATKSGVANFKQLAKVAIRIGAEEWLSGQLDTILTAPDKNKRRTALEELPRLLGEMLKKTLGH